MGVELDGEHDVVRRDRHSVMPLHIGAQMEGPGPVVRGMLPASCEAALEIAALAQGQ